MKKFIVGLILALAACSVSARNVAVTKFLEDDSAVIMLTEDKESCEDGLNLAIWRSNKDKIVTGCWFQAFDVIWIKYIDGDRNGYDAKRFKDTPAA